MSIKRVLFTVMLVFGLMGLASAQKSFPVDTSRTFWDRLLPQRHVDLGGSLTANSYGMQFSFPTLWIEERVKMELSAGFFWNDFSAEGFDLNPAAGARALYYFKKQPFSGFRPNSLYAGISAMATQLMGFAGKYTDQAKVDIVGGYSFSLNPAVQISPEVSMGLTSQRTYRPGLGLNVAAHF